MSAKITIKSPTRVDLAGGTLDLWPLYLFVDGALTVNVAIDIWTTAEITPRSDNKIKLISKDINLEKTYDSLADCFKDQDPSLDLLKVQLAFWRPERGFELQTSSQSPVGGGLGGSSSLTISLMKAFEKFCGRKPMQSHQMVNSAHNIEAKVLHTPTGTQDYYPAFSGGLNILKYSAHGIGQKVLPVKNSILEKHFMLVHTGKAHHSGLNNFEVLKAAIQKDQKVLEALRALKQVAKHTAEACLKQDYSALPTLFKEEYKWRVRLAPAFTSPEIEKLHDLTLRAGAEAVKICGAGGGGCVLVWTSEANRAGVQKECEKAGFKVLPAKPVDPLSTDS